MKILLTLLFLIPNLSWGHHNKSFDIDDVVKEYGSVLISIYNKTPDKIFHSDYLFKVYEKCNEEKFRIYRPQEHYVTNGYNSGIIEIRDLREGFCKAEPYHE